MRVNPFKAFRIDVVFFFGFAVIVVVFVGLIVLFSYVNGSREIASNTSYYQQKLLVELHKKLNTYLQDIEQSSNTAALNFSDDRDDLLTGSPYERLRSQTEIRQQLNNYVFSMSALQSIHVYSDLKPSYNIQDYVQFLSLKQLEQEDWYDELRQSDDVWLGERLIRTNDGEQPVIGFARRVYNQFNRASAVIVFNVSAPVFQSLITTEDKRSSLALFDETGRLITHSGSADFFIRSEQEIKNQLVSQEAGAKRAGDEFLVWSSSPDSKWSLVEITSWKQITAANLKQTQVILTMGLITIVLLLLLTVFLSRQFVKPVSLLLRAMSAFSLTHKTALPQDYRNEFGELFQGYEDLTLRIEQLYGRLDEQHKKRRASEMKTLQMMINPHFLYNSLDQVNWMAIEADQPRISRMLSHLAQFFRLALSNSDSLVTLSEELAHIESYLAFQEIRWEERLRYRFEIEEAATGLYVPKILLQPFIENAFIHGFHGRQEALLVIRAEIRENRLKITIKDDGSGLAAGWQQQRSAKGGYGLRNVRERIEALFGEAFGFTLNAAPEGGTEVRLTLPLLPTNTFDQPDKGGSEDVENSNRR